MAERSGRALGLEKPCCMWNGVWAEEKDRPLLTGLSGVMMPAWSDEEEG